MPISINGTGSITGLSAGGLPDASVTAADLASGAARSNFGAGAILQVSQTTITTVVSITTSATWTDITGLSVSITPSSSSNKILVLTCVHGSTNTNGTARIIRTVSGVDTAVFVSTSTAGSGLLSGGGDFYGGGYSGNSVGHYIFLDSPSSTNTVTYKVQGNAYNGASYPLTINATNFDGDAYYRYRGASSITVMEVAA